MVFLPSEVARLVLSYLLENDYKETSKVFMSECPALKELHSLSSIQLQKFFKCKGRKLSKILDDTTSLIDKIRELAEGISTNDSELEELQDMSPLKLLVFLAQHPGREKTASEKEDKTSQTEIKIQTQEITYQIDLNLGDLSPPVQSEEFEKEKNTPEVNREAEGSRPRSEDRTERSGGDDLVNGAGKEAENDSHFQEELTRDTVIHINPSLMEMDILNIAVKETIQEGTAERIGHKRKLVRQEGKGKRRKRCNMCSGCLAPHCGQCWSCKDKKENGGKGTLKKGCVERKCVNLKSRKTRPSSKSTNLLLKSSDDQQAQPKNNNSSVKAYSVSNKEPKHPNLNEMYITDLHNPDTVNIAYPPAPMFRPSKLIPISADLIPHSAVLPLPPGFRGHGYSVILDQPEESSSTEKPGKTDLADPETVYEETPDSSGDEENQLALTDKDGNPEAQKILDTCANNILQKLGKGCLGNVLQPVSEAPAKKGKSGLED